jgi:phage terminase small subunit
MGLSKQHRRFVAEYLQDYNATAAYQRAGYKARGNVASVNAFHLLRIPKVAAAIAQADDANTAALGITAGRVLKELARIAFLDPRKLYDAEGRFLPITDLDDDTAAAVAGFDLAELWAGAPGEKVRVGDLKKVKIWNKLESLGLLGKHLKLFLDRVEHSGVDGKPIVILYGSSDKKSLL